MPQVKAPKLHFLDSGLVCHLLGIRTPDQLRHHPLRGSIFESWLVAEIYKAQAHRGAVPRLWHYRDAKRLEVDAIVEMTDALALVEAKSGATVGAEGTEPLRRLAAALRAHREHRRLALRLVYGGDDRLRRGDVTIVPWHDVQRAGWA